MPDPNATRPLFDAMIEATNDDVREALTDVRTVLAKNGLADEELTSIELVLAEAMNNIVEHAYREQGGEISLCMTCGPNGINVNLLDDGYALPDGQMPIGKTYQENTALEDLPEGGFGWFLIRQLARDLTYSRNDGQNALTFRFAVSFPEAVG